MTQLEKLMEIVEANNGLVLASEVTAANIGRQTLNVACERGLLYRVASGVYSTQSTIIDEMFVLQASASKLVYSHETAAYLLNLCDRDPLRYSITLPTRFNSKTLVAKGIDIYFSIPRLYELGISEVLSAYGRKIKVYNAERTICDLVKNKSRVDIAVFTDVVKTYTKLPSKNILQLMEYAQIMNIEDKVRNYLEVLL